MKDDTPWLATATHTASLARKIEACSNAFDNALEQWTASLGRAWRAEELDLFELADEMRVVRDAAVRARRPWADCWLRNVGVPYGQLTERMLALFRPNMGDAWVGEMPLTATSARPPHGKPVVYVLYDADNEPAYVGSTQQFSQRVKNHRREKPGVQRWMAWPCATRAEAYEREAVLIREHKPRMNKAGV